MVLSTDRQQDVTAGDLEESGSSYSRTSDQRSGPSCFSMMRS
jgi:hypothetical protein